MAKPFFDPKNIEAIFDWYKRCGEPYPWSVFAGREPNPYAVWVSEVMLQQTTVAAVLPRFEGWMKRFPTVEDLANSSREEVLREWEGLGYYGRARNLHSAARELRRTYGCRLPDTVEGLRELPGVGDYIAAAVASIAFGSPETALEANGRRIAQRWAGEAEWGRDLERTFRAAVATAMRGRDPGAVNAAVMQFGQRVCLPRNPLCAECILAVECLAREKGLENEIPRRRRQEIIKKTTDLALLRSGGRIWIRKKRSGIAAGLWTFPARDEIPDISEWIPVCDLPVRTHLYTRYRDNLRPRVYESRAGHAAALPAADWADGGIWAAPDGFDRWAMPTAHRRIANDYRSGTCAFHTDLG